MAKSLNIKRMILATVIAVSVVGCSSSSPSSDPTALMQSALTAQQTGDNVTAKKELTDIVANVSEVDFPEIVATSYFNLGVLAQGASDMNTAIVNYKRALVVAPDYKPALYNLALAMTVIDTNSAALYYTMLLQISPDDANVLYNFGLLKYQVGNKAEARTMLKKAIKIAPELSKKLPTTVTLK